MPGKTGSTTSPWRHGPRRADHVGRRRRRGEPLAPAAGDAAARQPPRRRRSATRPSRAPRSPTANRTRCSRKRWRAGSATWRPSTGRRAGSSAREAMTSRCGTSSPSDSQFLNYQHYYQPADSRTAEAEASVEPQDAPLAPEDAETEESSESRASSEALDGIEAEAEAEGEGEGEEGQPAAGQQAHVALSEEEAEEGPERKDLTKAGIDKRVTKAVINRLLKETVAYVRDPANGISSEVGISDGFASQTPFPSGALAPLGMTALSKHLYNGAQQLPSRLQGKEDQAAGRTRLPRHRRRTRIQTAVRPRIPVAVPRVLPVGDAHRDDRPRHRSDHHPHLRPGARPRSRARRRRPGAEVDDRVQPPCRPREGDAGPTGSRPPASRRPPPTRGTSRPRRCCAASWRWSTRG